MPKRLLRRSRASSQTNSERIRLTAATKTIVLHGIGASPGLACGEAFVQYESLGRIKAHRIKSSQVRTELSRFTVAIDKSKDELEKLRNDARSSVGSDLSKIFDAQLMILEDDEFISKVRQSVVARLQNVEYLFQQEVSKTIRALARSKDQYMREMISDINSVSARLLHNLTGIKVESKRRSKSPVIGFASFFAPDEIMHMRDTNVVGFVTETGGPTSHMVLFAKALDIPAVVGVKGCLDKVKLSQNVVMDGREGEVIISPPQAKWREFRKQMAAQKRRMSRRFAAIKNIPSETTDGRHVDVMANLEIPTKFDKRLAEDGIGVGLYRTEFLYLRSSEFPDEEDQFKTYSGIVKRFRPQTVTLRTFDLGGDKFTEHFKGDGEANPALGWRAIRFSLDVPKIFKTQLRAMLRASAFGKIQIMFPMISSVEQIIRAKRILATVKRELRKKRVAFDEDTSIGIMIEIPAAVVMAHRLALEVNFFSIGTNDLTQYALAVDRGNERVAKWYRHFHPAVLRMIANTVEAGHENNIPVNICGEIAGDARATRLLVGLGLDSLSTNPRSIHAVKAIIPQIDYGDARAYAQKVLTMQRALEIENFVSKDYQENFATDTRQLKRRTA
jgi:phosphotransferase system enzyme I (PtsI)